MIFLPFKRYWKTIFIFELRAEQSQASVKAKNRLFKLQTFEVWAVLKINHFCFFLQEAEIFKSFPAILILYIETILTVQQVAEKERQKTTRSTVVKGLK